MTDNDTDSDDDEWPPDHPGAPDDEDENDNDDESDDEEDSSVDEETIRRITQQEFERFRSELLDDLEKRLGSGEISRETGGKSGGSSRPKPGGRIHTFDGDDVDGRKKPNPSDDN